MKEKINKEQSKERTCKKTEKISKIEEQRQKEKTNRKSEKTKRQ